MVERVHRPLTMYFGTHTVLLTLDVRFAEGLSAAELGAAAARLEQRVREGHPDIKHIFIEIHSVTPA